MCENWLHYVNLLWIFITTVLCCKLLFARIALVSNSIGTCSVHVRLLPRLTLNGVDGEKELFRLSEGYPRALTLSLCTNRRGKIGVKKQLHTMILQGSWSEYRTAASGEWWITNVPPIYSMTSCYCQKSIFYCTMCIHGSLKRTAKE